MSDLAAKIRQGRVIGQVTIGDRSVTIRRMTSVEMGIYIKREAMTVDIAKLTVIDWEGFKESDLIPGGKDEVIPFDEEAWCEWVLDHSEWWQPIADQVLKAYAEYSKERQTAPKQ